MKKQTKQKLIYARYILPPILALVLPLMTFIPAYRYTESGASREAISYFKLFLNSWKQGRGLLFGAQEISLSHTAFAKTLLTFNILCAIFYLVLIGVSVWACVVAMKLFDSDDEIGAEKARTLFITFFPNRTVLTVLQSASALIFAAFPYVMPWIYSSTLGVKVRVALVAPDALVFAIASIAAIVTLSLLAAPHEVRLDVNVFKKHQPFASSNAEDNGEDYESRFKTEEDDAYARLREEQAERIRRMLNKNNGDED
jgi:hypothetical protein